VGGGEAAGTILVRGGGRGPGLGTSGPDHLCG
jgi:hypothetical protein